MVSPVGPLADVLQRYDGETLRFFMLRTHYRSPINFSDANLDDGFGVIARDDLSGFDSELVFRHRRQPSG